MAGEDRIIEYIQTSLRSAKDLYSHGGHVTKTYADRVMKLECHPGLHSSQDEWTGKV